VLDSLNASVAAAIALYEAERQRRHAPEASDAAPTASIQ
jgi:tRNA(Leu) C34 or U34 (ribose-2'-O)-methylase TrmL